MPENKPPASQTAPVTPAAASPPKVSRSVIVAEAVERQLPTFSAILPDSLDPDRFARLVVASVKSAPALVECFGTQEGQHSVILAAIQAAAIGLEPNTPAQEAWILPRRVKGQTEAQLILGYRGLIKLALKSPHIADISARVVYDGDQFSYTFGLDETLEHKPARGDRGPLQYAYAIARFAGGGRVFEVLDRDAVESRRELSESWKSDRGRAHSPWTKWEAEMWRKTAVRALMPMIGLNPTEASAVATDERSFTVDTETGALMPADD